MSRSVQSRTPTRKKLHRVALPCLLILLSLNSASHAQLSVVNPNHIEMPLERAMVILNTACLVVADEFHQRNASDLHFQTVLVLGNSEEHYQVDEKKGIYTVYLRQWDERKFATLAMRFCVQRLASSVREDHLVQEILRRTDRIGPVSADALRGHSRSVSISPGAHDCYSATRDERCSDSQPPR
jgi:hypothetical protein